MLYLGHIVGCGKLAVPQDRAKATREYVQPVTKKGLWSFLGSVSYYRRFIPNIAQYTSLTPTTSKEASSCVCWSEGMSGAFTYLCQMFVC